MQDVCTTLDFILDTCLFDIARENTNLFTHDIIEERTCPSCRATSFVLSLEHTIQVNPLLLVGDQGLPTLIQRALPGQNDQQPFRLPIDALTTLVEKALKYQNTEQSNCDHCGPIHLNITITYPTPPPTLIIHISRAVYIADLEIYDDTIVEPLPCLVVHSSVYRLVAVAWHRPGLVNRSIRRGHYLASTLANGNWFLHDDGKPRQPLVDCNVPLSFAYCLFYIKES